MANKRLNKKKKEFFRYEIFCGCLALIFSFMVVVPTTDFHFKLFDVMYIFLGGGMMGLVILFNYEVY